MTRHTLSLTVITVYVISYERSRPRTMYFCWQNNEMRKNKYDKTRILQKKKVVTVFEWRKMWDPSTTWLIVKFQAQMINVNFRLQSADLSPRQTRPFAAGPAVKAAFPVEMAASINVTLIRSSWPLSAPLFSCFRHLCYSVRRPPMK